MPMTQLVFRDATAADVTAIVALIADDQLGAQRDDVGPPLPQAYLDAFHAIDADPNQRLVVAVDGERLIATAQLSFLPGIARRGAWRMQIEAVRVAADDRGTGIGRRFMQWCIEQAQDRGCALVQLTSDASRSGAHAFYASLGFVDSHVGFKLKLEP